MGEIIIGTMQTVCSGLSRVHTVTQTYCKTMVMMMTAVRKTMTIALMTTITMMITWLQKTLQCIGESPMEMENSGIFQRPNASAYTNIDIWCHLILIDTPVWCQ